jgi:hypothetical protein
MTLFGDMLAPLIRDLIVLGREIVGEIWHHPFPYVVTFALLPAMVLWGYFCLRFASEDA